MLSFRNVTYEEILSEINNLDTSESTQSEGIPFQDNADIFASSILKNFHWWVIDGKFPKQFIKADTSPVSKSEM